MELFSACRVSESGWKLLHFFETASYKARKPFQIMAPDGRVWRRFKTENEAMQIWNKIWGEK